MAHVLIASGVAAALAFSALHGTAGYPVSRSHTITQTFVELRTPDDVTEFMHRIADLPGVTGVTLVEYHPELGSARMTIFYDARVVSRSHLRLILLNNRILWQPPHAA